MKIMMLSPFSARSAGMNRLYQIAINMQNEVRFILPKRDKYGVSFDDSRFYFPLENKSFLTLPIYIAKSLLHLLSQKPDVVYFYKCHPFTFLPAILYKIINPKCTTLLDCDEWESATLKDNDEPFYKLFFMEILSKFCIWFADKIIYANEYIKSEKIPAKYWGKCFYLPNGVDTKRFKPLKVKKQKGFHIFLVSYLYKIKHILSVVEMVDRVRADIPHLVCHIIGDGPKKGELQQIIKKRNLEEYFIFLGVVPYEKLPGLLSSADAIVVPYSPLEGMHYQSNVKVFEFMSLGKPIIASDVGELRKYLENGKAGYIVHPDDAAELSCALISIYKNKAEAAKKASYAREVSIKKNDWKLRAKSLERILVS
ncbi:MAG: glycosyltransferase [Candidatus Micrarchaeota archaeon]|nr:glycosyltransferase [Candidatus Micrarchaeota archaeon]